MILWLIYIRRADYKFNYLNLTVFILNFIAVLFCFPPYFGKFGHLGNVFIVALAIINFLFIPVYLCKNRVTKLDS